MPRGDKTGPFGKGPLTGRGLGLCETGSPRGLLSRKLSGSTGQSGLLSGRAGGGFWRRLGLGRGRKSNSSLGIGDRWFNRGQ
ncbi:MAG: DUF5320 domain-containing protein [Desulfobacterota bacterium]|jgi:hypothetical protein|nr:DUF5320 domain-containing protein [Thermodesulfobacteriota bacterium]